MNNHLTQSTSVRSTVMKMSIRLLHKWVKSARKSRLWRLITSGISKILWLVRLKRRSQCHSRKTCWEVLAARCARSITTRARRRQQVRGLKWSRVRVYLTYQRSSRRTRGFSMPILGVNHTWSIDICDRKASPPTSLNRIRLKRMWSSRNARSCTKLKRIRRVSIKSCVIRKLPFEAPC